MDAAVATPTIDLSAGLVPRKFRGKTAPAAPAIDLSAGLVPAEEQSGPDFTSNPKGEGLYEMQSSDGDSIKVPYSKVQDAAKAGYKTTQKERERYARDYQWEIRKHNQSVMATDEFRNVDWANKDSASRIQSKMRTVDADALPEAVDAPPEREVDKERDKFYAATEPKAHEAGQNVIRRVGRGLFGIADMPIQAWTSLKDSLSDDPVIRARGEENLFHLMPQVSVRDRVKEFQDDWKKDKAQAVENVEGDAIGLFLFNKAMKHAPDAVRATKTKAVQAANAVAREMSGIRPKTAATAIAERMEENAAAKTKAESENVKAGQEHLEKTQSALHETRGRELKHQMEVKAAEDKALAEHKSAVAEAREHNQRVHQKAEAAHKEAVTKAQEHNQAVTAKYEQNAARIKEENAAAEHALELRRQREAELEQQTKDYYAKEDEVKAKAKGEENAAWQPWHEKMKGVEIDGGRLAKSLEAVSQRSPEISRMIRQLVPDPADAAPDSQYALDRAAIMKSQGIDPERTSYWDLPADKRVTIDKIAASSGFEPDPIDFDPQANKPIPVESIHRAKSILGRYIGSGRYEGMVLGEMKQVYKALDNAETRASLEHRALGDLEAAKKATERYQRAFGRERHVPRTQDEIREKEANPDAYKERDDEERLEAAGKHSPELVEMHRKIKDLRAEIRKMPSEDALRKSQKQVPRPPAIGDLREGYRLRTEPKYMPPSVGDLREGYRLKSEPKLDPALDRRRNVAERKRVADMAPEEMRQQLLTSDKTGLPNKRAFEEAQRDRPAPAVAISDADGLKAFNDQYGYSAGDALLKAKADALREAGLDAYHDKGDEFLYRGESAKSLREKLERAREILRNETITVRAEDGKALHLKGVDFSYGAGKDLEESERALHRHKSEREANGERVRGQLRGITEVEGSRTREPSAGETAVASREPRQEFTPSSTVESPFRVEFPDRPKEVQPEIKKFGTEDITAANRKQFSKTLESLRARGIWYGAALPWLWVARDLINLHFSTAAMNVIGASIMTVVTVAGLTKLADVLERPAIQEWIAKPSLREMRELEKMPADQRKDIAEGFKKVRAVARKKGYKVSPAIVAYISANGGREQEGNAQ